jgi:hypothetical protein
MKITCLLAALLLLASPVVASLARDREKDQLCPELATFLASVKPEETRTIKLHTYWGARQEGDKLVLGSKSCEHNDYEPGKRLCTYLMEHSSTEFAGYNAKRILNCLSPKPQIAENLQIQSGSFSTSYGSPNRGALVDLEVMRDREPGEMVLRLQADGY